MKLKSSKQIAKIIRTYEVHPELPGVTLKITHHGNKLVDAQLQGKGPHGSWPLFMKPGFREYIQQYNPWVGFEHKYGIDEYRINAKDLINDEYEIDPANFVWVYSAGALLFDISDNPIPTPYCFDYIGTPFTNAHCDLEGLLAHLQQHPWITNAEELYIDDVPYYNNDTDTQKYIRGKKQPWVCVRPDAASLKEIYQVAVERDKKYFSVKMKELLMGGPIWTWSKVTKSAVLENAGRDYLNIRQFSLSSSK